VNFLTEDLPGTGGRYKQHPNDFQVEEIPLYPCSGSGEHLYLWIEKKGITTRGLLHQLSRQLKVNERNLGYAGLKDAQALTRQMVSIPFNKIDQIKKLNINNAKILNYQQHGNKLRLGHLAGNRFTIILRNVNGEARPRAEAILKQLQEVGVPNLFGEQRYGILGNSAQLGLYLLQKMFAEFCREFIGDPNLIRHPDWKKGAEFYRQGDIKSSYAALPNRMRDEKHLLNDLLSGKSHRTAVLSLPRKLLRLFLSAAQAQLFDQLLRQRLPQLGRLIDGDIAVKHSNGACFRIEKAIPEQHRADNFEISPSAPLFGHKVLLATEEPGEKELDCLKSYNLTLESWNLRHGLAMSGERRPLRVPIAEPIISEPGKGTLMLQFALPRGSYATSVLREVIKPSNTTS
jgi:tRNA pseudouridine13 synthase